MSEQVSVTLPGLPPRSLGHNGRGHWSQRRRDWQAWRLLAWGLLRVAMIAQWGDERWMTGARWPACRVQVTWRYAGAAPDPTGCIERLAPVWDAAEAARLIPNDRHVLGVEVTLERVPRRSEQEVVLVFERADEER